MIEFVLKTLPSTSPHPSSLQSDAVATARAAEMALRARVLL